MIPITINITEDQAAWISTQSRGFNMSALLRRLLDKHIHTHIAETACPSCGTKEFAEDTDLSSDKIGLMLCRNGHYFYPFKSDNQGDAPQ